MIPKKGQYFRVEHKGIDKSWRGDIFICTGSDNGIVVCKMVSSERNIYYKIFNFPSSEWNFFTVSSEVLEANGITIKNEKIMAKTKADSYMEWARIIDMCEGTGVDLNSCWKYEGVNINGMPYFDSELEQYEFALGIVEGKPVFKGDELYWKKGGSLFEWEKVEFTNSKNYEQLTWTKPERTFSLNGVELPCPINEFSNHSITIHATGIINAFCFSTKEDKNKILETLIKILKEAEEKS